MAQQPAHRRQRHPTLALWLDAAMPTVSRSAQTLDELETLIRDGEGDVLRAVLVTMKR